MCLRRVLEFGSGFLVPSLVVHGKVDAFSTGSGYGVADLISCEFLFACCCEERLVHLELGAFWMRFFASIFVIVVICSNLEA